VIKCHDVLCVHVVYIWQFLFTKMYANYAKFANRRRHVVSIIVPACAAGGSSLPTRFYRGLDESLRAIY
jgi:hypothetical protein